MTRSRRCVVLFALAVLTGGLFGWAEQPANQSGDSKSQDKWLLDRALTISPQAEPRPALKYRLFPTAFQRKPGNAVPIYLRLVHQQNDATRRLWVETPEKWNKLPPDRLPLDEARKFLKDRGYMLRQLELGARRQRAEWEYTLDAGDPIGLLLPDMQSMRGYVPLLVLQARVAMAEGDYPTAVRTLETGFCLSRHIAEAPFLISSLVGVAAGNIFSDTVLDLIERPGAPNLYWALTALPRPLVSLRKGNELEQAVPKLQFPDLADLMRGRTAQQWDEMLKRIRKEVERISAFDRNSKPPPEGTTAADPASKSPDLATARKYLTDQRKLPAAQVKEMPDAQVLVLYLAAAFQEFSDDYFKAAYLPFPRSRPLFIAADKRVKAAPDTEPARLARLFLPALPKVSLAQNRLDRRLAALRVIEALRLHAAANDGKLPSKLSEVKVVPVPNDPGIGKPFVYKLDGKTATLSSTIPGEPLAGTGLRYRLSVRAK